MKIINLFLAVVGFLLFSSCGDEYDNTTSIYFKTMSPKEELALGSSDLESSDSDGSPEMAILYTGLDLEWYNGTTRELKFKDNTSFPISGYVFICLEEEVLFELRVASTVMSNTFNFPVFVYDFAENQIRISKGYPDWTVNYIGGSTSEIMRIREENWKEIEPGWNKFIAQLKKEGRYRK